VAAFPFDVRQRSVSQVWRRRRRRRRSGRVPAAVGPRERIADGAGTTRRQNPVPVTRRVLLVVTVTVHAVVMAVMMTVVMAVVADEDAQELQYERRDDLQT